MEVCERSEGEEWADMLLQCAELCGLCVVLRISPHRPT
jgi:hypothetical protein